MIASIRDKDARLAILDIVDLSEVVAENDGVSRIVFESVQELLLKLLTQNPILETIFSIISVCMSFDNKICRCRLTRASYSAKP